MRMRLLHSFTSLKCMRRKNLNERRMLIRWWLPRTFVNFAYPEFHSCSVFFAFKPIPLRWVGLPFTLASIKNKTHGTQSMGFETIHQPKSKDVFSFRVFPWNSVAILMLSCPTVAYTSGSERCVLHSVFFRVRPWLILLLILGINSVANSSASASAWSFFRGKCFCLCLRYPQNWTIPSLHINQNRRNG